MAQKVVAERGAKDLQKLPRTLAQLPLFFKKRLFIITKSEQSLEQGPCNHTRFL